jgi:NAD(P)-dependent dehydrogenase (short-subunit alcohol dehydrogenase family)
MTQRIILVTGGTGKLGRSLVEHFLGRGDRVLATGRSESSLAALQSAHPDAADQLYLLVADFCDGDVVPNLVARLAAAGMHPDALINNARSLDFLGIRDDGMVSRENFLGEYLVDVVVPYELTMALAGQPGSRLRHVVNIGSQYGTVAANPSLYDDPLRQSPIHYGVAKAALAHLTRELAVRLAPRQIRANCVAFGGVEGRVDAAFRARYSALCPQGRMLRDAEVIGPVEFLLNEESSAITGQIINADGGWSVW